jgi:cytochrome P450
VTFHRGPAWLLTRYHDVADAFRDEARLPSAAAYRLHSEPVQGRTLQCMDGEEHRVNRALVAPAFRATMLPRYVEPILEPVAHRLVDELAHGGTADLVADFTKRFPFAVITRLLGLPPTDDAHLHRWALGLVNFPWDPQGALAASGEFTRYLAPLVAKRRHTPGDDLLSRLATTEVEGQRLSNEEIFSFVRLLFPAGADTTYLGLGNLLLALLTHPDVMARVVANPARRAQAIEEGLRWETPVAILPRRSATDVQIGDETIPADATVLFAITAANRDPAQFPDPDRFDLDRFDLDRFDLDRKPAGILTFGLGVHFCLGSHLARAEIAVALDVVLERLPNLRLVEGREPTRVVGSVLRGPNALPVAFDTRVQRRRRGEKREEVVDAG